MLVQDCARAPLAPANQCVGAGRLCTNAMGSNSSLAAVPLCRWCARAVSTNYRRQKNRISLWCHYGVSALPFSVHPSCASEVPGRGKALPGIQLLLWTLCPERHSLLIEYLKSFLIMSFLFIHCILYYQIHFIFDCFATVPSRDYTPPNAVSKSARQTYGRYIAARCDKPNLLDVDGSYTPLIIRVTNWHS